MYVLIGSASMRIFCYPLFDVHTKNILILKLLYKIFDIRKCVYKKEKVVQHEECACCDLNDL